MKPHVAAAFSRAAPTYDTHAGIQRTVAARLLSLCADRHPRSILEIGAGTGILTAHLVRQWPDAMHLTTDLCPAMLALPHPGRLRVVCDAASLPFTGPFDLVVGSMVAQWFTDFPSTIQRLRQCLSPDGCLALSLPVAGSFPEWRASLPRHGLYPLPAHGMVEATAPALLVQERITRQYAGGWEFLQDLKGLGANTPAPGSRPVSAGHLRAALRRLDHDHGGCVSWIMDYGIWRNQR